MQGIKLFVTFIIAFIRLGRCELYPSIQWNPNNALFAHNTTQCVYTMSKVIFVCPNIATVVSIQQEGTAKERMYENLWLVDRESYEQCRVNINNPNNRQLLRCTDPLQLKYYTVVFQKYSASVWGPEYKPGKEYYFIATSDGTQRSLLWTSGGHCRTNNMRLEFHICHNETDVHCESPDKCDIRKHQPTEPSPTTPQWIHTTNRSTTHQENNTKEHIPKNPNKSGSRASEYLIGIAVLLCAILLLLIATAYLIRRLRQPREPTTTDVELENLHSPRM